MQCARRLVPFAFCLISLFISVSPVHAGDRILFASNEYTFDGFGELKVNETVSLQNEADLRDIWFNQMYYLFRITKFEPMSWYSRSRKYPKDPEFEFEVRQVSCDGKAVKFYPLTIESLSRILVKQDGQTLPAGKHYFQINYVLRNAISRKDASYDFDAFSSSDWGRPADRSLVTLRLPSWATPDKTKFIGGIYSFVDYSTTDSPEIMVDNSVDAVSKQRIYKFDLNKPLGSHQALLVKVSLKRD